MKEMDVNYQNCIWIFHGESNIGHNDLDEEINLDFEHCDEKHTMFEHDMKGMVRDAFEWHQPNNDASGPNNEATTFFKLIEEEGQPLYPGCEEFTKLSFITEIK